MFIKINASKQHQYVQVVRSYREDGKVKHDVLFNLGRLDEIENNPEFQKVFTKLSQMAGTPSTDLSACSEAEVINWGYLVYKKLWSKFRIDEILRAVQLSHSKAKFDLSDACFLMSVQHLLSPTSKLGSYGAQHRYIGLPEVELNHLYRSLDLLSKGKEAIESHLFQMNRDLFNMQIDVVFYDVTTFHFESTQQDSLRNFGFSKAAKFNEVQVVLGMLVDCEGRPVGYELFSGNTTEGKTFQSILNAIDKRFGIRKVIVVADRGLNSKLNLKAIKDKGYGYIVASRIKSMPHAIQSQILDKQGYQLLSESDAEEQVHYKILDFINKAKTEKESQPDSTKRKKYDHVAFEEKLIITYSDKRAKKDKQDRQRLLDKANYLLADQSRIRAANKRSGKKYIKEAADTTWALDDELVTNDEKWDGYYGIQTSEKEFTADKIVSTLRTLWRIEESFRIMKSTLEVRPIFHWTPSRIQGHFVVCFLSFLLERTIEIALRNAQIKASPEKIKTALNSMQFAQINLQNDTYLIKTKTGELATKILRQFKIQSPKNIMPASEFRP